MVGKLALPEIKKSESLWIFEAQKEFLDADKKQLEASLGIYFDENYILRCKGRLNNSKLPNSTCNPILLPNTHPLTSLVVKQAHEKVLHGGMKDILAEFRTKYWVIHWRRTVRSSIKKCVFPCNPLELTQLMTDLPGSRISSS